MQKKTTNIAMSIGLCSYALYLVKTLCTACMKWFQYRYLRFFKNLHPRDGRRVYSMGTNPEGDAGEPGIYLHTGNY